MMSTSGLKYSGGKIALHSDPGEGQSGGAHRGEEKRAAGCSFDASRVRHRGVHDRLWAAQVSGQSAGRSHPCPEGASPNCIPSRP
ncbi:hypothetical protein KPH14_012594 [Odynerus spinipes]|uniref:Uncharacterized protein n=1 Tax=Odynerus spinipes TaxID=1348599 RepID=A0AAD9VKI8_9HYME|nr:hypothetical protein KPH14_012594 [Odynerus spinipes]